MARSRVLLAHTGGTIGMRRGEHGYAPDPGYLAERLAALPELSDPALPETTLEEFDPLLDSSDMVPADWERIARVLERRYHEFDGFVVLHGTDTLAYSASALAFLLEGLGKPVIVTGSQIPLAELRNDARDNLITSLLLAARDDIAEVCVYAGGTLLRGVRATKVSAYGFDAFTSPNEAPLASVGVDVRVRPGALRPGGRGPVRVRPLRDVRVAALRLFPGVQAEFLRTVLQPPLRGLVLETYGAGNAPSRDPALHRALAEATARGVVVVNCSQCLRGRVDMEGYATGAALARVGVVSGGDMTAEAALTKLIWLLGQDLPPDEVARLIRTDLRGERTP